MDSAALLRFALLIALNVVIVSSLTPLGPADITIERVETCDEPEIYPIVNNIVMHRINRTHGGFNACFQNPADLGPTSTLKLSAAKWGDGGWKPNAFNHVQDNVCETANMHVKDPWTELLKATGRENNGCPITKGEYCIKDFVVSLDGLFPNMLYGKFRVDIVVVLEKKPIYCFRLFILSTPSKATG